MVALEVVFIVFLGMMIEYFVHRIGQHQKIGPWWYGHAVEHHRDGKNNDSYLNMGWVEIIAVVCIVSPILWLISYQCMIIFVVLVLWWWIVWGNIHKLSHECGGSAGLLCVLCPWYKTSIKHHLKHHDFPGHNFGAVFFWTDWVFGTIKR